MCTMCVLHAFKAYGFHMRRSLPPVSSREAPSFQVKSCQDAHSMWSRLSCRRTTILGLVPSRCLTLCQVLLR
ncbi:hypothetical protein K438DRAFT_1861165 [Mycena galopus ATCC 62051]|nr:hypothetical protein K438DRAFT_1861165 [Mycena galopus ATCC 62051]